jgi:multidrug efflux system outer membrane protein
VVFWAVIAPRYPALFTGAGSVWGFGAQVTQPIFTAGRLKSNVKLNKAQQESAIVRYQSTVQGAFREVSDALIAYRKNREVRAQQELAGAGTSRALASRLFEV